MKKNVPKTNDETLRLSTEGCSVLVAEDDGMLRKLLCHGLTRWGFNVVQAEDGCEALACLQFRAHPIEVLVTDINMPGINGVELAKETRKLLPDVPILVMSSNFSEEAEEVILTLPNTSKLEKPFDLVQLREKLQELLAASSASLAV